MAVSTIKEYLPILGLVLILVIISSMVINFFNINLFDNSGFSGNLNRVAVYEGYKEKEKEKEKYE